MPLWVTLKYSFSVAFLTYALALLTYINCYCLNYGGLLLGMTKDTGFYGFHDPSIQECPERPLSVLRRH